MSMDQAAGEKRPAERGRGGRGKRPRFGGPPFGGGRGMGPWDDPYMWGGCPPFPGDDMPPEGEYFDMFGPRGGFMPPPPWQGGPPFPPMFGPGGPRGRGMPRFRGRGGFNPHPYDDVNPDDMLIAEKIRRFTEYIKCTEAKTNAIQTIENAITGSSRLGLKTIFETEELMKIDGKPMFTGYLKINGVFLHRSIAVNKKELKHEIYTKALDILTEKSIVEILSIDDVGVDVIRQELQSSIDTSAAKSVLQKMNDATTKPSIMKKLWKNGNIGADTYAGIERLSAYLRQMQLSGSLPENNIQALEQAFNASHSSLMRVYETQVVGQRNGRLHVGRLMINEIPVAQGKAAKKKECKLDCYTNAVQFIINKPADEIVKGVTLEEFVDEDIEIESTPVKLLDMLEESIEERMKKMINYVKNTELKDDMVNMTAFDIVAMNIGVNPTVVFKRTEDGVSVDFYLDDIFITTGSGQETKEAEIDAYTSAWEILSKSTESECDLISNHKLTLDIVNDDRIFKVQKKGWSKRNDNNNLALKRNRPADEPLIWKHPSKMILVEHNHWATERLRMAFNVLTYSVNMSGMALEWRWVQTSPTLFKCEMAINQIVHGIGVSSTKHSAKQAAAVDALFKLYETQSVLRIDHEHEGDPQRWVAFEEIKKLAVRMEQANPAFRREYMNEKMKDERFAERQKLDQMKYEKMLAGGEDVTPDPPIDPYIVKVCMKLVDDMANKETLDDLIIGPGMSRNDKRELGVYVRLTNKLRMENRSIDIQHYFAIFRKFTPLEYVDMLNRKQCTSPRVRMMRPDELPKRTDANEYVKKLELGNVQLTNDGEYIRKKDRNRMQKEKKSSQIAEAEVTDFDKVPEGNDVDKQPEEETAFEREPEATDIDKE